MSFYIYVIHNIVNIKVYVGKTENPSKRWNEHRQGRDQHIDKSMKKEGIHNFYFSTIQEVKTEREVNRAETYWISFYKANAKRHGDEYGYNLADGGEGSPGVSVSQETRDKRRAKMLGRIVPQEVREKISRSHIGIRPSPETLLKMSGENSPVAKLKNENITVIRHKYNSLGYRLVDLAIEYNVSPRTIARVIYNIDWYDNNYIPPIPRKTKHTGKSKLTLQLANQIRLNHQNGLSRAELAESFNITRTNIDYIIHNKIWKTDIIFKYKHYEKDDNGKIIFRGENNYQAKLIATEVIEIRNKNESGNYSQAQLAKEYGVSETAIGHIIREETWKHLLAKGKNDL